jgi:hypothetical protein
MANCSATGGNDMDLRGGCQAAATSGVKSNGNRSETSTKPAHNALAE